MGDNFLLFMNTCLQKYKYCKRVWHIGGWSFPIDRTGKFDIFSKICNHGAGLHGMIDGKTLKKSKKINSIFQQKKRKNL